MKVTSARLADGREIVYYDEADDTVRAVLDRGELGTTSTDAEIRYDVALDEWVAIAAHRPDRTHLPPTDECPLCPSARGRQTEIPSDDYDVVVFENRFPTFSPRRPPARWTAEVTRRTCSCSNPASGAARSCCSPPTTTRASRR